MSISKKVLERVAKVEGKDPAELDEPLFEVVDPDALDAIFESGEGGPDRDAGMVDFEYLGYRVRVTAGGDVLLRERSEV